MDPSDLPSIDSGGASEGRLRVPELRAPAARRPRRDPRAPLSSADPLAEYPRERVSHFFITFNTNYAPTDEATYRDIAVDLMRAARATIGNREALSQLIFFRNGVGRGSMIKHVAWEAAVEQGQTMGYVHMHAILSIRHTVPGLGIHLQIPLLQLFFQNAGQTAQVQNLPYINVKAFPEFDVVKEYIMKNQGRSKQVKDKAFLEFLGLDSQ